MTRSVEVRARLVDILRRDLVGPGPQDEDLARERLSENPSRWYLTGFIAPKEDEAHADDPAMQEEDEREAEQELGQAPAARLGMTSPASPPPPVGDSCRRRSASRCSFQWMSEPLRRGSAGVITLPSLRSPRACC